MFFMAAAVAFLSAFSLFSWPPLYRVGLLLALLGLVLGLIQRRWPFEHVPRHHAEPWRGRAGGLGRACLVPALLIGCGLAAWHGHGLYSSEEARRDILAHFSRFHTTVDNYFQFLPYLELGALVLLGVDTLSDRRNTGWLVLRSEVLMLAFVYSLKYATAIDRPDGTPYAFPSGHTAQAFLAASLVHQELRHKSPWYGVGAYAIAAAVGVLRMLNNKHWEADVLAGAGLGILAAHLAYFFHRTRPGRGATPAAPGPARPA